MNRFLKAAKVEYLLQVFFIKFAVAVGNLLNIGTSEFYPLL
jgi:hypothetical protein